MNFTPALFFKVFVMFCIGIGIGFLLYPNSPSQEEKYDHELKKSFTDTYTVFFDYNSFVAKDINFLKVIDSRQVSGIIFIIGHADTTGADAENTQLSIRRALTIKRLLSTQYDPELIIIGGQSSIAAKGSNPALNRKAVIYFNKKINYEETKVSTKYLQTKNSEVSAR